MIDFFLQINPVRLWEFTAISLLSIGSLFTLGYSFFSKEKFQQISLCFFLIGSLLWLGTIFYQVAPLATRTIHLIGYPNFLISLVGLCIALGSAWKWIKKNQYLWFIFMVSGILIVMISDIFKEI